jgi:hypothetical protein
MTVLDKALYVVHALVAVCCVVILLQLPSIVAARKHEQQLSRERCSFASAPRSPRLIISE